MADEAGHEVVAVYRDHGLSGRLTAEERPGLTAALADVEDGCAERLVVHRLDRLARELHVHAPSAYNTIVVPIEITRSSGRLK